MRMFQRVSLCSISQAQYGIHWLFVNDLLRWDICQRVGLMVAEDVIEDETNFCFHTLDVDLGFIRTV